MRKIVIKIMKSCEIFKRLIMRELVNFDFFTVFEGLLDNIKKSLEFLRKALCNTCSRKDIRSDGIFRSFNKFSLFGLENVR